MTAQKIQSVVSAVIVLLFKEYLNKKARIIFLG